MADNLDQLSVWSDNFGGDVILLNDANDDVWNQYRSDQYKPQFIVFDRDLTIVDKGVGPEGIESSENAVLQLLNQ